MAPPPVSWSDLPEDLLELIFKQVTGIGDLYHCHSVCRFWRSIAGKLLALSPPRLLFKRKFPDKEDWHIELVDYFTGISTLYAIPKFKNQGWTYFPNHVHSSHGWLVIHYIISSDSPNHCIYLYNPFSRMGILLPIFLGDLCNRPKDLRNLILPPIKLYLSSEKPKILSCIIFNLGAATYALWERKIWGPGHEKRIPILRSGFHIHSIIRYKNEFYGIDSYTNSYLNREIAQFLVKLEFSPFPRVKRIPTKINKPHYISTRSASYLVESSSGNLLLVYRTLVYFDTIWRFEVYKLIWEKSEWEKITSLGDQSIFLSSKERDSICIRASASTKYKQNCIYFVDYRSDSRYLVAEYDMGNQTVARAPSPLSYIIDVWNEYTWFRPEI